MIERIRPLGRNEHGLYFYQNLTYGHVVAMRGMDHRKTVLWELCGDIEYWKEKYPGGGGRIHWDLAARTLMDLCNQQGFFNANMLRGSGIWLDRGRVVAHLGDSLLVDGERVGIDAFDTEYIYENMVTHIELPEVVPTFQDIRGKLEVIAKINFCSGTDATLIVGEIICGILSGIISWRPHLWITGDEGTGKEDLLNHVFAPIWTPLGAVYADGNTTEAGLREIGIKNCAVPVIINEGRSRGRGSSDRVKNIIAMARTASEGDGRSTQFRTDKQAAFRRSNQNCYVLCSMTDGLLDDQDKDRFSVIRINGAAADADFWPSLRDTMRDAFTPEFSRELFLFCATKAKFIQDSIDKFKEVLTMGPLKLRPKYAEQCSHLLGGAWSIMSAKLPSADACLKYYTACGVFATRKDEEGERYALDAFRYLMDYIPPSEGRPLGAFVEEAGKAFTVDEMKEPNKVLREYGMRVERVAERRILLISTQYRALMYLFKRYGVKSHRKTLLKIRGVTSKPSRKVAFNGHQGRVLEVAILEPGSPRIKSEPGAISFRED